MPREPINLDGQKFGHLTVEQITDQRNSYGRLLYQCRCECGNIRLATAANLKRGEITRCKECQGKTRMKDLTGQRFGRLVAIKPVEKPSESDTCTTYKWLCVCDCGNVTTVSVNALTTGKTKSCGCLSREKVKRLYVGGTAPCKLNEKEKPRETNTSGRTGVYFDQSKHLWCAEIMFRGEKHFLGRFAFREDAIKAREKAEEKYFEKFLKKQAKKKQPEEQENIRLSPKVKNRVGKTFGGLKVLGLIEKRPKLESRYLCQCVECGKIIERREGTLKRPPKSCGCLSKPTRGSRTIFRTCLMCGKDITTYVSQDKMFCSRDCFSQYRRENGQTNEKFWRIKSPSGEIYEFMNLSEWAAENWRLIDPNSEDPKLTVRRFCGGMATVKKTFYDPNGNFKTKSKAYKGWTFLGDKEEPAGIAEQAKENK